MSLFLFQGHPWLRDIKWDSLYETEAAYKPIVNGDLDTQNFEKFDEVSETIEIGYLSDLHTKIHNYLSQIVLVIVEDIGNSSLSKY